MVDVRADETMTDPQFRGPLLVGIVIAFVVFTIAITLMGLAAGADFVGSLGLGVFGAFWGGIGFGAMGGAVYAVMRAAAVADDAAVRAPDEQPLRHAA
jgi:hypothetical protein